MLRREAAGWLARLQSGRDPEIERKFRRWRDADPAHAAAFERVSRSYDRAGLLRHSSVIAGLPQTERTRPLTGTPRYAMAAALAAVVLIPAGLLVAGGALSLSGTHELMLATMVGQIREVKLSDGSRITLDTSSSVNIEIWRSRRHARLNYGRARFEIAAAGAPFVVDAAGTTVTARQGIVDVERTGQQSRVDVLAGRAAVHRSGAGASTELTLAGGQALASNSATPIQARDLAAGPDWTQGMLQFDGTPLPVAIGLVNRYSDRHILIQGNFDDLRVTGAFHAGDTAGFAKALAAAFDLSLARNRDGSLLLSRHKGRAAQAKNGG